MATEIKWDQSLFERIGDKVSLIFEGFVGTLSRILGASNEREVQSCGYYRTKDPDKPYYIKPGSILARINDLEPKMQALSDTDLKELSLKFRQRIADGRKAGYNDADILEEILPEAFAACREAGWRTKRMRHFDVQLLGGIVLHRGGIAEMVTGEGKTLVATLPAFLNALTGEGVHVVTVNDYLARRDCEWMLPIYHALGVSAGYIQSDMDAIARRKAYDCDITYGTNSEFGFDYLRDNMKPARWGDPAFPPHLQQVQRKLNYAIIDEVDNILIDEARTPLIISGPAFSDVRRYEEANRIAVALTELQKKDGPGTYFEVKEKEHSCHLTDAGIRKAEELAGVESFYTPGNMEWPHLIDNALKAHHLYHKDKKYMIMRDRDSNELSIVIIDEFTGRAMFGRQWSDGLHQAIEAKHAREGVRIKQETQTLATITLQNYFKLYKKLAGMTGTAMTEATEFWKIYGLNVVAIPTNRPLRRKNYPDLIYRTDKEKWDAVVQEIERVHKFDTLILNWKSDFVYQAKVNKQYPNWMYEDEILGGAVIKGEITKESETEIEVLCHPDQQKRTVPRSAVVRIERKGRPILIGTTDVAKSEKLSAMLKRRGIKHELLNAKPEYVAREAEIVSQAGRIGAVTISTNMAGRGTDIILGGNPETLAWMQLRDKYPSRLEVPDDVWKQTVEAIEAKEKTREEGRRVAQMGGLYVIGTERHESRRIDNQLRGRAGRQGDPGASRFYVSLQDDLMRLFAGEWVAKVLTRLGMEEGQAIESSMVTRRIEKAQKKVEEYHFEIRKNLLEYDEVMDYQRKRIYGRRQEILNGANPKAMIMDMVHQQLQAAIDRYLDADFGPASFAEFAQNRLGVEFEAADFRGMSFEQATQYAQDKAVEFVPSFIQELMDENFSEDEDPKDWKWQEASRVVNARYGLKTTDRDLKKIGRDNLANYLLEKAEQYLRSIDLSDGKRYLNPDWGLRSLSDWMRQKFQVKVSPEELAGKEGRSLKDYLLNRVYSMIRDREIEFPVKVGMTMYMPETTGGTTARPDREGLYRWALRRFGGQMEGFTEEDFRTQSRARLKEMILELSKRYYPAVDQSEIDVHLEESFRGTKVADPDDAKEISDWAKGKFHLDVDASQLVGLTRDQARQLLWNAFDLKYRFEMSRMEREVLLDQLDSAWKKHLLTMDHLRAGIGLVGYAQIDPKTEYKRLGMKEFEAMWEGINDKVTDTIFRIEEMTSEESFRSNLWQMQATRHDAAASLSALASSVSPSGVEGQTNQPTEKKREPIRNTGPKIGRNDPCPCGSGKKYKNCHLREAASR